MHVPFLCLSPPQPPLFDKLSELPQKDTLHFIVKKPQNVNFGKSLKPQLLKINSIQSSAVNDTERKTLCWGGEPGQRKIIHCDMLLHETKVLQRFHGEKECHEMHAVLASTATCVEPSLFSFCEP